MFALRRSTLPIARRTATRRMAGDVPVPQSQHTKFADGKPLNEGWESTIAWFYPSSFLIIVWIHAFEPDTDIRGWANAEARARLELKRQGMTEFKFGTHYQSLSDDELKKEWDTFSAKALKMVRSFLFEKSTVRSELCDVSPLMSTVSYLHAHFQNDDDDDDDEDEGR